jgi:hypothetical protein
MDVERVNIISGMGALCGRNHESTADRIQIQTGRNARTECAWQENERVPQGAASSRDLTKHPQDKGGGR